jgi:hypothetical protein
VIAEMSLNEQRTEAYNQASRMGHQLGLAVARRAQPKTVAEAPCMNDLEKGKFDATIDILANLFPLVGQGQIWTVLTRGYEAGLDVGIRRLRR